MYILFTFAFAQIVHWVLHILYYSVMCLFWPLLFLPYLFVCSFFFTHSFILLLSVSPARSFVICSVLQWKMTKVNHDDYRKWLIVGDAHHFNVTKIWKSHERKIIVNFIVSICCYRHIYRAKHGRNVFGSAELWHYKHQWQPLIICYVSADYCLCAIFWVKTKCCVPI